MEESNAPATTQTQTGVPRQPVDSNPEQPLVEPTPPQETNKKWLLPVLIVIVVLALGTAGFFAYQNSQMAKQQADQLQPTISPTSPTPITKPTTKPPTVSTKSFNYNNFSIGYPDSWVLLDMSTNEDFPIKERLSPLYGSDKVIALNKNGIYLIITIEEESKAGAGGIFLDDGEYNEFISDKDKVLIGSSTFYLNRSHFDIPSLLESHTGPFMWGALAEYLPSKTTEPGKVFKGYENVIKRNGYTYNFIVVSNEGGQTDTQIQNEIVSILESIEW